MEFLIEEDYAVCNTWFNKQDEQYVTFKDIGPPPPVCPPWTPERFAMLDLVLAPHRWKNIFKNVASHPTKATDSDHSVVTATLRIKLTGSKKDKGTPITRYRKPDENDRKLYNEKIRELYQQLTATNQRLTHQGSSSSSDGDNIDGSDEPNTPKESDTPPLSTAELFVQALNQAAADT